MVEKKKLKKIILGSWPVSGDYSKVNEKDSIEMLKHAYKIGINEFDTAPNYGFGKSEFLIGTAFKSFKKKPKINTKIGNNHKKVKSFNLEILKESFGNSLKLLNLKKINILYLHNPKKIENEKEIFEYLNLLKRKKKINKYGLSISKDFEYKDKFIDKFDTIQLDHNILYLDNYLNTQFKKKKVHARSPFASGTIFLNTKKKFLKNDYRNGWLNLKRRSVIISQLKIIEKKFKLNIYHLSLKFLLEDKFVNKIIFGVKNKVQLIKLISSIDKTDEIPLNINEYKNFYFSNSIFKKKGF